MTALAAELRTRLAAQYRALIVELGDDAADLRASVEAEDWATADREYQRLMQVQVARAAAAASEMKAAAEREREGAEFWTAFMAAAPPAERAWLAAATAPWWAQVEEAVILFTAFDPGVE